MTASLAMVEPASSPLEVKTPANVDALEARIRAAAQQAGIALRALPDQGLTLLRRIKFEQIGCHPLKGHPLNLIEQVNQTWTCLVGLAAARLLLERHPEAGGFRLNLGAVPGFDLESLVPGQVQAETFAAVHPRNNRKLEKDLRRLHHQGTARHRYVVFRCPRLCCRSPQGPGGRADRGRGLGRRGLTFKRLIV